MDKQVGGVACAALAIAALVASPVAANGKDDGNGPPAHAPAHGVHGTQPGHGEKPAAAPATTKPESKAARRAAQSERQAAQRAAKAERRAAQRAAKTERKAAHRGAQSERKAARADRKAAKRSAKTQRPAKTAERPGSAPGQRRKAERAKGSDARSQRTQAGDHPGGGQPRTTICHATGSDKNPFVVITTANPAVINAHRHHHGGTDIVPAPGEGCPQPGAPVEAPGAATADGDRAALGTPRAVTASSFDAPAAETPAPTGTVRRVAVGVGSSIIRVVDGERIVMPDVERQGVLGDAATVDDRDVLAQTADTGPREDAEVTPATAADNGGLPFTGLQTLLLALIGAGALLAGIALHRASRQPARR